MIYACQKTKLCCDLTKKLKIISILKCQQVMLIKIKLSMIFLCLVKSLIRLSNNHKILLWISMTLINLTNHSNPSNLNYKEKIPNYQVNKFPSIPLTSLLTSVKGLVS